MHNIIEKDKTLEEIIAESGKLLIQLQDKGFRKQIKPLLQLKAILDNESVLDEKQRDSFHALFQSLSPLDRLQKQISILTTANQQTLRSQVGASGLYQATDISFAASSALSLLWNCYNGVLTQKADKGISRLVAIKKRRLKAQLLYTEIMTRQALEEGRPTREFIDELPLESRQKLTTLIARVDEALMVKEFQELGQYLYHMTPKEQLIKDTPEIKNINIQAVDYIIKAVDSRTSFVAKAKSIEFWLNVMQSSKSHHNFYGAQIIRTAFMDNRLYKLVRKPEVWKFLSPANQEILQELEKYSIHRDTKDVEELLTTSSAENKTIIPSIAGIKILAESLKGRSVNNESNAPDSASTIQHKQRIQRLLDVAYENLPEKPLQPSFLNRLPREEKLMEGTVGHILLQQLTAKDNQQGVQSLLSIIQKTSLENQKAFIESYNEVFAKNLNLSELKKTFSEYAKKAETIQALQNQWVESKKNIYEAIDSHKAALKTAKNAKARKSIKKEIRKLDDQLKTINKNFKSQVSNNKKLFDQSKKPAVNEALKAAFLKVQESFVQLDPTAEGHAAKVRKWIEPALKSPTGYIGDLFNAPMVQLTENNPSLLDLRHAFENNTKISDCLYVSGKMGGANDPGRYGGNYLRCFQTADGQIQTQMIFFKQATDHGLANQRENMAEVLAGHIMNGLSENLAASIILAKPHDLPSKDAMANPDEAYVGSLFFHEFTDVHKKSHQMVGQPAGKRGKGTYGGQNINNPVLGNPHFQTGFNRLVQEEKLDVANLAKGIMSSLLVGNYQIHTENVGIAKVGAKKEFVTLDFGGAFRRLFKKKGAFKTQEQSGQFPKAVLPYLTKGRKYDACYLLAFPQEIRESKEFIQGIEAVAEFNPEKLFAILEKAIDYIIQYYGEKTFIKDFASKLDTTKQELDVSSGTNQQKIQKTKKFLYFRLLSRQLSLKNFALNLKLKNPAFDIKEILADNPVYSKYQSLGRNEKFVHIITESKALLSWLVEQDLPELKSLENFLNYALSGDNYDLTKKDDQDILIQTINEIHQKIRQYHPNLLEQMPVLAIADAPRKSSLTIAHEDTRQEIKSAEHKLADAIKQLVKHASLAPLKLTKGASPVDGWMDTYSKAIEVIKRMALIRQFGRSAQETDQPMQLDFNYLLLTTLAGNQQEQLQSYLHIKRALQALDGVELTLDLGAKNPTKVYVNASVMSTGINVLQKFRAFSKAKQTLARENRKSYQRLTQAVREYPLSIEIKDQTLQKMVDYLRFNVQASLSEETEMNTDLLVRSQEKLGQLNESLRKKWHLYKKTQPGSEERKVMQEILTDLRQHIKTENQILDKIWNKPLEEIQKRAWNNQKAKTAEALTYLQSSAGKQQLEKLTTGELQALNVYILKAKMDDLYFSGQYLEPKSAAIFNTYFLIVERITGIMSNAGYKNANDRTAIIQVMTALLSENPQAELSQLLTQMSADISDTAGGTPNFSFLAGVELGDPEKLTAAPVSAPVSVKKPDAISTNRLGLFSRGAIASKRSSLSLSIEALCQRIESQNAQESQKEFRYYKKDELANVVYRLAADQQQISGFLRQENLADNDRERLTQTLQNLGRVLSERTEMRDTLTMVE